MGNGKTHTHTHTHTIPKHILKKKKKNPSTLIRVIREKKKKNLPKERRERTHIFVWKKNGLNGKNDIKFI